MKIGYRKVFHHGKDWEVTRLMWDFGYVEFAPFVYDDGKYSDAILSTKPLMDFIAINVFPEYRGQGKTATMIKTVSRWARNNGFNGIFSCAYGGLHEDGIEVSGLVRLLEKHGYKKEYENKNPNFIGMLKILSKEGL
jgi:GNAT superfamily N-acetyltransferase